MPPRPGPPRRQAGQGPTRGSSPPAGKGGKGAKSAGTPKPRGDGQTPGRPGRPGKGDPRTKQWGGVARRGTRNLEDAAPGSAAAAWRDAADKAERARSKKRAAPSADQDVWVDAGPVRDEASAAVRRAAAPSPAAKRSPRRRAVPNEVAEEVSKAAGPAWAGRVKDRLADAARAYEAERYRDARRILEALLQRAPSAIAVRELLGLTYYRLGKWRDAIKELGAVELLSGSVDHHPVIADCQRAMGRLDEVERLWDELRRTGAGVDVVIEGRIVLAGAYADKDRVADAIRVLEQGPVDVRRPQQHHLRLWYALAALYERAGDVTRARGLFHRVVMADPAFADAGDRLDALG